jgi:hypothetical protein
MIDNRSLQRAFAAEGYYSGQIDGKFGPRSRLAGLAALRAAGVDARAWPEKRQDIAFSQWLLKRAKFDPGKIDGFAGPSTKFALEQWQNALRDIVPKPSEISHLPTIWPRQSELEGFYGKPGTNLVRLDLPFEMRIAWDLDQKVKSFLINEKCAESAARIYGRILELYGYQRLVDLNLDRFGGCYNNRKMRGGNSLSTHAYACSIDHNPEFNQLRWGADRAHMAKPECAAFVDAFEAEGWISLGRELNYDWMHFQAARL